MRDGTDHLRSLPFALIFLTIVAAAALAGSASHDGLPPVSADSFRTFPPAPPAIHHQPAAADAVGHGLQDPVSPSLAGFVIDVFRVDTPVVVGKTAVSSITLKNNGTDSTGAYDLAIFFTADGGATRTAAPSGATSGPYSAVQSGASASLALEVEVPGAESLPVGAYQLCAQIQATVSGSDSTAVGNSKCELVFVLPDMSDRFPDVIHPMHYQSPVDIEWSIGNCVPRSVWEVLDEEVIPNLPGIVVPAYGASLRVAEIVETANSPGTSAPPSQQTYWLFMPKPYTKPAIMDDLHDGIHGPFEFGALSKYGNRVQAYKEIALEIATGRR